METKPLPGFACSNPNKMDESDRPLIWFISAQLEEIGVTQTISQKLSKASGGTPLTCFQDIVPKLYQEFKDVFTKESFNELPDW